jgi:hypothetical protein
MKKKILLVSALAFYVFQSFGQTVKVDAELRSRGEYRDGFREPLPVDVDAAFVNNLRTKLNAFYESEDIKAKLSLLDTRTYGKTTNSSTGDGLGVLEAWGEYNFTPEFSFALGRQGLEYDDKRIFSYNNWSNTPGAHDLLLLKYSKNGYSVHAGSAYNNAGDSVRYLSPYKQTYKTLNFIRLEKILGTLSASAVWVNDSYEYGATGNVKRSYRNTIGGYLWLTDSKNPFHFILNGYYQFGKDKQDKSLSAYLLSAKATQKLTPKWEIYAGTDVFSGSKNDIASNKSNTFNKLYGTNHAFNGSIEYWSTLPTQGLVDLYAGAIVNVTKNWNVNLAFHHFSTGRDVDADGTKNIGSEIDLTINYTINKQLALQGGWSNYFTNKGSDILKKKTGIDTRFPQWAYVQITFKPVFFNKK